MPELSLLAALLVGLLGGGHCAGMCGGIITAVSFSMPGNKPSWRLLLAYNLGRIASYTLAGVIAGAVALPRFFLSTAFLQASCCMPLPMSCLLCWVYIWQGCGMG